MKTVIDNEGRKITVTSYCYYKMRDAYKDGYWSMIIKTGEERHIIILAENFN